jgi:NAD+ synthase
MSAESLAIALVQINPIVGDLDGNLARLREARARAAGADIVIASELVITGYPPEDLVRKPSFLARVAEVVHALAADTADGGPAVILGAPWCEDPETRKPAAEGVVYNAALLLDGGEIQAVRAKWDLPNYGVFDEKRLFTAGTLPGPMNVRGHRLGVMVCEDSWTADVTECLEENGAEMLIAINGSPFEERKHNQRLNLAISRVLESGLPFIYLNQVGGQDELVFDGGSFALDGERNLVMQLPSFEEHVALTHWTRGADDAWTASDAPRVDPSEGLEAIYRALKLGLRDYVDKNGFPGVVIGLSGGIDSALTAAVAVDALGPERVRCLLMPSPYTSAHSTADARACAELLGVKLDIVRIDAGMTAFDNMLAPLFEGMAPDTTEENVQARLRGIALMAVSNKFGPMVLSTGNKSEMSVGYSTLYGDMAGGYNVLKDVYKTRVYQLAHWRNTTRPGGAKGPEGRVIPERILTKAPSAELKPDQTDQDSLPPYDELDDILACLIEDDLGLDEIAARGHAGDIVRKVWRMLEGAEYKRRQAPPGVKITRRSFGRDRRYPITNKFKA